MVRWWEALRVPENRSERDAADGPNGGGERMAQEIYER